MDEPNLTAVRRWLIRAGNDLRTARTMLAVDPPITDVVCFHAQQCAEKSLKAFLVFADIHVERTHYLPRLVELCSSVDSTFEELRDLAVELTDYAVVSRYPDDWRDIPIDEASEASRKAEEAMTFVRQKIKI